MATTEKPRRKPASQSPNAGKTANELNEERRIAEQKELAEERAAAQEAARARGDDHAPEDDDYEPLLDIKTVAPKRPGIHIDDAWYEIKLYRDFGIAEHQRIRQDVAAFDKLWQKPDLTKKEGERLKVCLDRLFDKVLIADAKTKAGVVDEDRLEVVMTFQNAPLLQAMRKEQAAQDAQEDEDEVEDDETLEQPTLDT